MPITIFSKDVKNVSKLSNLPNDEDGLSAEQLKSVFDQSSEDIKEYINAVLIPEVERGLDEAALGITQGKGISTNAISDSAVTTAKISDNAITTIKLAANSVDSGKIANNAITGTKLANASVTTEKLYDLSVTTAKISNSAITNAKIADRTITESKLSNSSGAQAVSTGVMRDGAVTTAKIANAAVTYEKTNGVQKKHRFVQLTLNAGAKTWTLAVSGLLAGFNNGQSVHWGCSTDAAFVLAQNINLRAVNPVATAGQIQFKADSNLTSAITILLEILD